MFSFFSRVAFSAIIDCMLWGHRNRRKLESFALTNVPGILHSRYLGTNHLHTERGTLIFKKEHTIPIPTLLYLRLAYINTFLLLVKPVILSFLLSLGKYKKSCQTQLKFDIICSRLRLLVQLGRTFLPHHCFFYIFNSDSVLTLPQ